jgi:cyanophycinase-like exopeptidase
VDCTVDTPALAALRKAWDGGAVIAGCSAGAMVFGAGMPGCECWGWLPDTVVAPHFGQYDIARWCSAFPSCSIVGIPDGSMAVVDRAFHVGPVGSSELTVLDPITRLDQS